MAKEEMIQKVKEMITASSCCKDLKDAGNAWIESIGTAEENKKKDALLQEIKEDIVPIDGLIAFASSESAKIHLGEDSAKHLLEHAQSIKESGAETCDCPACTAGKYILDHAEEL